MTDFDTAASLRVARESLIELCSNVFRAYGMRSHGTPCNASCATVVNRNHFGIGGWYATRAIKHDMIAMTDMAVIGVSTFGAEAMFGANPLAVAAPADRNEYCA